jgi:hypothetical protein
MEGILFEQRKAQKDPKKFDMAKTQGIFRYDCRIFRG